MTHSAGPTWIGAPVWVTTMPHNFNSTRDQPRLIFKRVARPVSGKITASTNSPKHTHNRASNVLSVNRSIFNGVLSLTESFPRNLTSHNGCVDDAGEFHAIEGRVLGMADKGIALNKPIRLWVDDTEICRCADAELASL